MPNLQVGTCVCFHLAHASHMHLACKQPLSYAYENREKCLRLEAPILICHGNCAQRIKKNGVYYSTPDGTVVVVVVVSVACAVVHIPQETGSHFPKFWFV